MQTLKGCQKRYINQVCKAILMSLFQKVNSLLGDSSTLLESKGFWVAGMIKAWDIGKTPLCLQKWENKPVGKMLKIGSFWWNEAVWINERNSFYLNHLWCEMGSHTEKSLETSDCSTLGRRGGGGEKMEFLSIYLRINKVISKVTMEGNLCWLQAVWLPQLSMCWRWMFCECETRNISRNW